MDVHQEEIVLPALPHSEPTLPAVPNLIKPTTRKRPFLRSREPSLIEEQLASAIHTSSDPALFSSDETPDAENYSGGVKRRRKKTYEGTWWGEKIQKRHGLRSSSLHGPTKKRSFRRNFDSGIFMADDSSATDLSSEGLLEQQLIEELQKEDSRKDANSFYMAGEVGKASRIRQHQSFSEAALKLPPRGQQIDAKDVMVGQKIQDCLDKNNENVDLTSLDLKSLPVSIKDLKSMIKRINSQAVSSSLTPFEAELRIYLGNNDFSQFPSSLLELTNTRLLSFRQNSLTHLPQGIRSLHHLQELNVSSNSLEHLPFEIVRLLLYGDLTTIHDSPNPWKTQPASEEMSDLPVFNIITDKMTSLGRRGVSQPEECLADGSLRSISQFQSLSSKQPHLSEVVLRALLKHNTSRTDLSSYLTDDHPDSVKSLLSSLHAAQSSGGRTCTFCSRDMVLPRWQWYEWWNVCARTVELEVPETTGPPSRTSPRTLDRPIKQLVIYKPEAGKVLGSGILKELPTDRILPFQRSACGCVDVRTGLERELRQLSGLSGETCYLQVSLAPSDEVA